jgi:hypothetical protein
MVWVLDVRSRIRSHASKATPNEGKTAQGPMRSRCHKNALDEPAS